MIAPITNASVVFVRDGTTDSVGVVSDEIYGDYNVSLSGEKDYLMYSSADGFVSKDEPISFSTKLKTTQLLFDTLTGLGMVAGMVTMSSTGVAVANASISLIDITNAGNPDTLIKRDTLINTGDQLPIVQGFQLFLENEERLAANMELSGWNSEDIFKLIFELYGYSRQDGIAQPADYRIDIGEVGLGHSHILCEATVNCLRLMLILK